MSPKTTRSKKSSDIKETKAKSNLVWYKDASKILTLISIIAAASVGILGILNTRSVARLDRDVYVPKLQYYLGEYEPGKIFLDVENQGSSTAQNVTIAVSWKTKVELGNCEISSPFQDIEPVTPLLRRNLTFRIPNMVVGGKFQLICEIVAQIGNFEFSDYGGYKTPIPPTIDATRVAYDSQQPTTSFFDIFTTPQPTPIDPYDFVPSTTIPPGFILLPSYIDKSFNVKTTLGYGDIEISIAAENSQPAIEIRPLPLTIITYLDPYSRERNGFHFSVHDYSLADFLRMFHSMSEKDFIKSCNDLKDKWVLFENVKLDKLDISIDQVDQVTVSPLSEEKLEIRVDGELQSLGYDIQEKDTVNISGAISRCEKIGTIQIWLHFAFISKSQVVTP